MDARQRRYVKFRVDGLKQKEAAIAAGYAEKTAPQSASRLEAMPKIKEAIVREAARRDPAAQRAVEELMLAKPGKKELADPLQFFSSMMTDNNQDPDLRLKAAQQLAAYTVAKPVPKKASKEEEREQAAKNSFFASALQVVK